MERSAGPHAVGPSLGSRSEPQRREWRSTETFLGCTHPRARGVARGLLCGRMERLEECDESRCLRRRQVLPIRRHIAVALDHLSDELILRQPHRHVIERWPALTAALAERMTIAALLRLENQSALPLQRSAALQIGGRYGSAA